MVVQISLDEGDAGVPEPLEKGGLGGVSQRGVADEDRGGVALAAAGGDDEPADVARAADDQHPAPLLPRRNRRHVRGLGVQDRKRRNRAQNRRGLA